MKHSLLSEQDIFLFHQGNLFHSYNMMGAHLIMKDSKKGAQFTVWAPNAKSVNVVGSFNNWDGRKHQMNKVNVNGLWTLFIPDVKEGDLYKYELKTKNEKVFLKSDPYAFFSENRPNTAAKVVELNFYRWNDQEWLQTKRKKRVHEEPMLIYEIHLGSWKLKEDQSFYTYRELAKQLVDYVLTMGYTHIEILPLNEHPLDQSWGYQATGYFSVTSRYGSPDDFKYFVDYCHQKGIGVILDWVPGHFCKDDHGLRLFDGTPLYEYSDPIKAEKLEWGTLAFDLGRPEVISFLISNAIFWMDVYHIDGLRVDAVSNMLYYNHGKDERAVVAKNQYGGYENLEAIAFVRKLNETIFDYYPNALMMAEEATSWPNVSAPTYLGGLGFNFKWNMGWMNDMLKYMEMDPIHRKYHHQLITFSFFYAFSENFILPLSHDEVVHGKKSLLNKMPGDYWQKFANLRLFYGYKTSHPGKKLLFMGGEIGQFSEWKDREDLDWELLDFEMHKKIQYYVKELNSFYLNEPALWQNDHELSGFEWIDPNNFNQSIISFIRKGHHLDDQLIILCNFTPVVYENYKVGVPFLGDYIEIFNSDSSKYGGSGQINQGSLPAVDENWHSQPYSLSIKVPPLAFVVFRLKEKKVTKNIIPSNRKTSRSRSQKPTQLQKKHSKNKQ